MLEIDVMASGDQAVKKFSEITDTRTMAHETVADRLSNASDIISALSSSNSSIATREPEELPDSLKFGSEHELVLITYSILICISVAGNVTVLVAMLKRRQKARARINTMFMHLAIADLIVTLLLMPIDMYWAYTVQWIHSDFSCRAAAFLRIFGLYLSGFIIICISVDRYFAVLKPMNLYSVDRRGKCMLTVAWLASALFSIPQMFIFHVVNHPEYKTFLQCTVYESFQSKILESFYLYAGMVLMYLLPLAVILFCYTSIVLEIFRRSQESTLVECMRRSGLGFLGRAKKRTLKMTIITVLVFLMCWTPYYVMCVWIWVAPDSANALVDPIVKRGLFLFASANSCMNPIVYGIFNIRTHRITLSEAHRRGPAGYSGRTSCAAEGRAAGLNLSLRSIE